ncbi:MAG: deoxyribonuclease IV [Pseudomonadales bacterium]|nr:deoxyribonuclease IV [Pseudomonadales bacterium]
MQRKIMQRKIGGHVSASGGLAKAVERANDIGANCLQLFSGSPRVWKRKDLSEFDTSKMFSKQNELSVEPIFTHSLYLINLATDKPELLEKSFNALKYDLEFDSLINGSGIVVHLGSHQGRGWESVREQVAEQIYKLLNATSKDSTFLIENSAGQNGKLCSDLSEIRWLIDRVSQIDEKFGDKEKLDEEKIFLAGKKLPIVENIHSRLGWCFDTCHAHAAGYYLGENPRSIIGMSAIEAITENKLWKELKCIHVNDSRDDFSSGRDRHENLGTGKIPTEDFQHFLNFEKVKNIPLIIEVPGFKNEGPDKENIEILKSYCS